MRKVLLSLLFAFCFMLTAGAQDRTITGKVLDNNGAPLSNVTVEVTGGGPGTQTLDDGSFRITVSSTAKSLIFSRVGYTSVTSPIRGSHCNILLQDDTVPFP